VTKRKDGSYALDTVTPTAKAVGKVHVATLNHHGHGGTTGFVTYMDPPVLILQGWCSDQPPRASMEMLSKPLASERRREMFATDIFEERLQALGPLADLFASVAGHVVVRVYPPDRNDGSQQQ
jgi:hypothetical protein